MVNHLAWIDSFYRNIAPHVFLRREDGVLILPPNRVYRMNDTAFELLEFLADGGRIEDIAGLDEQRCNALQDFFKGLKALYEDDALPPGVERVPFDFSFTRLPILGEIALTYRCNNLCRFCYAGCGPSPGVGALSLRDVKRIIDIFQKDARVPFFSFTGGEPLLYRDLEKAVRYARSLNLKVNLITNGTLATGKRSRSLYRAGLRTAQVSLEAPSEAVHDQLVGIPGAFSRTVSGIRALQDAGISVQTNTTITTLNRNLLTELPAFLSSLGVRKFSMNLFIPTGRGIGNEDLFVSYREVGSLVDEVRKAAFAAGTTFYWYSPTPHCHYNPIARGMGNKSCAAMDGLLSVNPDGNVVPCSSYPQVVGNILREDFRDIWFSRRASWFKQKRFAPAECTGCESFLACQGACPLYWSFAGTGELSGCTEKGA